MRATTAVTTVFAAICIVAAGCSGGNGPGIPASSNVVNSNAASAGRSPLCRVRGCSAKLVVPLRFDGRTLSIERHGKACASAARPYTASRSTEFSLTAPVALPDGCIPSAGSTAQEYYIAAAPAAGGSFTALGGPGHRTGAAWVFAPMSTGIALNAGAKYIFYVASVPAIAASPSASPSGSASPSASPSAGPSQGPGNYVLLQPLSFNGTTFSVVSNSCFQGGGAPPYVAPTSGPLVLSGAVTLAPTCVPSPLPSYSPLPQLYIVAVQLNSAWDAKHHVQARRYQTHRLALPMDFFWGVPAVAVAGGATITDTPWSFAPDAPGLTLTAGSSYAFFIAVPLPPPPPTPSPAPRYRTVVPLTFDGTNFAVPAIASCHSLPTPVPYAAPTSGPLVLSAPVSIAPTCAPAPPSWGSWSPAPSATPGQLYIIAALPSNGWGGGTGGSIGAHHTYNGCIGWTGGGSVARPAHGWGGWGGCFIEGFPVAGPVDVSDNPWSFAPLAPELQLTGGTQYDFYIGQLQSRVVVGGWGGHHH